MSKEVIQKFVENEDRRLSYYIGGNRNSDKVLFFINGLYHGQDAWIKQQRYPFFYKNYQLLFMDYRGIGDSIEKRQNPNGKIAEFGFDDIVEDIKLIIDNERFSKITIIGYSIGGMISLWFVFKLKEYVDSLILLNTAIKVNFHTYQMVNGLVNLLVEGADFSTAISLIYPWNHSRIYLEKIIDIDLQLRRKYAEYNKDLLSFKLLLNAIRKRPDLYVILRKITVPTLIIGSDEDVIFPAVYQDELVSNIENCNYRLVTGCGHSSFIEKYEEVNSIIEKFLKKE